MVSFMLTCGAHVDDLDEYGWTALMLAANLGHKEIVIILLENDADTNILSLKGLNASKLALKRGHTTIVEIIEHHVRKKKLQSSLSDVNKDPKSSDNQSSTVKYSGFNGQLKREQSTVTPIENQTKSDVSDKAENKVVQEETFMPKKSFLGSLFLQMDGDSGLPVDDISEHQSSPAKDNKLFNSYSLT